jgi:hypothetical protein
MCLCGALIRRKMHIQQTIEEEFSADDDSNVACPVSP